MLVATSHWLLGCGLHVSIACCSKSPCKYVFASTAVAASAAAASPAASPVVAYLAAATAAPPTT